MTFGSLGTAVLFVLAAISQNAMFFALATTVMQVIAVATAYDAAFATINQAAGVRAQRTITHLTLIAGFSSTVFWPLTGWLIEQWGWRGNLSGVRSASSPYLHAAACLALAADRGRCTDRPRPLP